jgi:hypothetical protein
MRIFVRDQDEAESQPTGILKYVGDLSLRLNADIGRKDFFEMASNILCYFSLKSLDGIPQT